METPPRRLKQVHSEAQESTSAHAHQEQAASAHAESVEALIQHDVRQTEVPPVIAQRLVESIAREFPEERPWWKRVLGS